MITINNPQPIFSHDEIKRILESMNVKYFCMSDEHPPDGTYHTHLYIEFFNAIAFSRIQKLFPTANIQNAYSDGFSCRNYVGKFGFHNAEKAVNQIENSFFEQGQTPSENSNRGHRSDWHTVKEMIENGNDVSDVIDEFPHMIRYRKFLDEYKQDVKVKSALARQKVNVTFIYGATGLGKTMHVMDKYGDDEVCHITDYHTTGTFDDYTGQDVLLLDEFDSSITIPRLNRYCDFYKKKLPARYYNRTAVYKNLYIVSNIPLEKHFINVQRNTPKIWDSFIRRIDKIMVFKSLGVFDEYSTEEYFKAVSDGTIFSKRNKRSESEFDLWSDSDDDIDFDDAGIT